MSIRSIYVSIGIILSHFIAIGPVPLFSQNEETYFQQEVHTTIRVNLDDEQHKLIGTLFLEYTNHSPSTLDTLWFHLWANAYQSRNSAFTRQKLAGNNADFYFAREHSLGGYDSLDFFLDGRRADWQYDKLHRDIAWIRLEKGLKPGEKLTLSAPFVIKIPESFSRMGHSGDSYQISQWFPKPAVFDRNGWHPMPYLDMGEFYSEFGDYDVTITLPENYWVAATGSLTTASEWKRMQERMEFTNRYLDSTEFVTAKAFPPSSIKRKSIRFIAENVHDFAWFADKRYLIQERELVLREKDTVRAQVFFLPAKNRIWGKALDYVERGLIFYDSLVGPYPYPKVVAVEGALEAGSGMEYPMVTVIGKQSDAQSLDHVIIHEIGHNWFYGVLAFNEREHPWMDEGINSYYDHRYQQAYYSGLLSRENLPDALSFLVETDWLGLYQEDAHKRALAQASNLHSEAYTPNNYLLSVYENPARALRHLSLYLGVDRFDQIMQSFYRDWAFRHPQPDDFRAHWERESGEELDWLFDGFLGDTRSFNYGFRSVVESGSTSLIRLYNDTRYPAPLRLAGYVQDSLAYQQWINGFSGDTLFIAKTTGIDKWVIDPDRSYPDPDRRDNYRKTGRGQLASRPLSFGFLNILDDPSKRQISWLPSIGWNKADGFMLGMMFFNTRFPKPDWQFQLHPMYALGSEPFSTPFTSNLTGQGRLTRDWHRNRTLRMIRFSLSGKSFHYDFPNTENVRYQKWSPSVSLVFNKNLTDRQQYEWGITGDVIRAFFPANEWTDPRTNHSFFLDVSLRKKDHRLMLPSQWMVKLESGNIPGLSDEREWYLRAEVEFQTQMVYALGRKVDIRLYGGYKPWSSSGKSTVTRAGTLGLIGHARNDYRYADFFFDRGTQEGFWASQLNLAGGGFKTPVNTAYGIGQSNNYVAALNLKTDLPFRIAALNAFKLFFDLGAYSYLPTLSEDYQNKWLYSGGILLDSFEGALNLYLPLIQSREIGNAFAENRWFIERLSFSMNLNLYNFSRLLDREDLMFAQ